MAVALKVQRLLKELSQVSSRQQQQKATAAAYDLPSVCSCCCNCFMPLTALLLLLPPF
jgi:hypothetical protein